MDIWSAILLGIIQGLTEFIPVSSTAHLILAHELLGVAKPADPHAFDTIIQAGTLLPVLLFFKDDWANLFRGLGRVVTRRKVGKEPGDRMAVLVAVASLPAFILGPLLERKVEQLASPEQHTAGYLVIGSALVGVGLLMWWVDHVSRKRRALEQLSTVDALAIGVGQATALIPGVSRSGATITAGLLTGLTREAAARFSFLISAPVLAAAVGYKTVKLLTRGSAMSASEWIALALGMVAAAVVGYASIKFLLAYLRRNSLGAFAYYRVVLGLFLIGLYIVQQGQ